MKRIVLSFLLLAGLLSLLSCSCSAANTYPFPNMKWGLANGVGDATFVMPFFQGWYNGTQIWWILYFATNDLYTTTQPPDLVNAGLFPKLISAADLSANPAFDKGAKPLYKVLNFQQPPVFSTAPGNADYSALWQMVYVTWNAGSTPVALMSEADVLAAQASGDVTLQVTNIVIDLPVIALGPLGGPWWPAPEGGYRLQQVVDYDPYRKFVVLPVWYFYGQITRSGNQNQLRIGQVVVGFTFITDVADPALAEMLQANVAPGLNQVDAANTQRVWAQDWKLQPPPPPGEFPIMEWTPDYVNSHPRHLNTEYNFSPIMNLLTYQRVTIPPYTIINNPRFLQMLFGSGAVAPVDDLGRINAMPFLLITSVPVPGMPFPLAG